MKNYEHWKITDDRLFNYPCLKHSKTKELCIFGKLGEIWIYDNNTFSAIIYKKNSRLSKHLLEGEEAIIKRSKTELSKWLKLLKTPHWSSSQLKLVERLYQLG